MKGKSFSLEDQLKEIGEDINKLTAEIESRAKTAIQALAVQTHAKIVEKVQSNLRSTRNLYLQNLGMTNEGDNMWMVFLKKDAQFIEEGLEPGEMFDRILNNGKQPKVSKDGHKYKTIPFEHSKNKQNQSLAQQRISNYAKSELKKLGLDKPIMKNGKVVTGRAATVHLTGPNAPVSKFNRPLLQGLTIYQREVTSSTGKKSVKRDVFTFRTISDAQRGSGLWYHPGLKAKNFFEQAEKEIEEEWNKMFKEIVDSIK